MFSSIQLRNFKSFINLDIEVRPLTVLSGLNSGGKSSILQAIRIFIDYNKGITPKRLSLKSLLSKDSFYEIGIDKRVLRVNKEGEQQTYSLSLQDKENDYSYSYISADRIGPMDLFDLSSTYSKDVGADGRNVYSYLEFHQDTKINEKLVRAPNGVSLLVLNLKNWMDIVTPGFEFKYEIDSSREKVIPFFNGVKPSETGFGLSYVFPVIVSLLVPCAESGLLLLENPEAHLHPRGQFELGKLIALSASTGKQIILETHSEHIIDGIRVAVKDKSIKSEEVSMYYLYRDDYESPSLVEQINVKSNGKLDKWPAGFFDQSTISKMELL